MHCTVLFIGCTLQKVVLIIINFADISTQGESCTTQELRLVGGRTIREGRVEICINNAWGTICNTNFGSREAEVTCTQMGFSRIGEEKFDRGLLPPLNQ